MTGQQRRALIGALALFAVFEAIHVLLAWDNSRIIRSFVPSAWIGPAAWAIYSAIAAVLLTVFRRWRGAGLLRPGRRDSLALLAYPLLAGTPFLLFGANLPAADYLPLIVVGTSLIAFNEEAFFRGLMLDWLRPLGWRRAIVGSAVLFGSAHALNLVSGANIPFTVMQIAATTAGGVALAAIRIRSGSLWPVIVLHIVFDAIALATLTGPAVNSPYLLPILFLWFGLNLSLWWYGWRLLKGRSDEDLDRLYDGLPEPAAQHRTYTPAVRPS